MNTHYTAIIAGNPTKICGFVERDGKVDLAADGRHYMFAALVPSQTAYLCKPLREVATLRCESGYWIWNECENLSEWLGVHLFAKINELTPESATFLILGRELQKLDPDRRSKVAGVAWFKHDDGEGGWNTPILLSTFHELARPAIDDAQIVSMAAAELKNAAAAFRRKDSQMHDRMAEFKKMLQPFMVFYKATESAKANSGGKIVKVSDRFQYLDGFKFVCLDKEWFDLRGRDSARACLHYLVQKEAFEPKTARSLDEIDAFVRKKADLLNRPGVRIHDYFANDRKLKALRDAIKAAGRNGRYHLKVT